MRCAVSGRPAGPQPLQWWYVLVKGGMQAGCSTLTDASGDVARKSLSGREVRPQQSLAAASGESFSVALLMCD
jgi:hypothetical protein